MDVDQVNAYNVHKHCLLPDRFIDDVIQITQQIVALHATGLINSYISLWARMPLFSKSSLEKELYEKRSLVKMRCMRGSLFIIPSNEMPYFYQAYQGAQEGRIRDVEWLIQQVGVADKEEAPMMRCKLQEKVLSFIEERGPATVQEVSNQIPELKARMQYMVGKTPGSLSLGSRLIPAMCDLGLLVRGNPRGSWKSSLYEYALLSEWQPDVDLGCVTSEEAQIWLVERYLSTFAPATIDDITWWTGFNKEQVTSALKCSKKEIKELSIPNLSKEFIIFSDDLTHLRDFKLPKQSYSFLLPALDPLIMGYTIRRRFLDVDHYGKIYTRDGNAVPSVWIDGRIMGVWGQRKDGSIIYKLFKDVRRTEARFVDAEVKRLEALLGGEVIPQPFKTKFLRSLL